MLASAAKTTEMVPIWGMGEGSAFVGNGVYLSSMAFVGLNWVLILARLDFWLATAMEEHWMCVSVKGGLTLECHSYLQIYRGIHRERFSILLRIIRSP